MLIYTSIRRVYTEYDTSITNIHTDTGYYQYIQYKPLYNYNNTVYFRMHCVSGGSIWTLKIIVGITEIITFHFSTIEITIAPTRHASMLHEPTHRPMASIITNFCDRLRDDLILAL
jgi:hypothetical protein